MTLNTDELAFLAALAAETDATRRQLHLPSQLMERYPGSVSFETVGRAASLVRKKLAMRRTQFGVARYAITEDGRRELRASRATEPDELALVGEWSEASRELGTARTAYEQARLALEASQMRYEASHRALDAYYELKPAGR